MIQEIYSIENLITEGTVTEKNHKMERYLRSAMRKEHYGSECIKMDMVDFHKLKHDDKVEFARRLCRELNVSHLTNHLTQSATVKSIKVNL